MPSAAPTASAAAATTRSVRRRAVWAWRGSLLSVTWRRPAPPQAARWLSYPSVEEALTLRQEVAYVPAPIRTPRSAAFTRARTPFTASSVALYAYPASSQRPRSARCAVPPHPSRWSCWASASSCWSWRPCWPGTSSHGPKCTPIDIDTTTVFTGTGSYFDTRQVETVPDQEITVTRRVLGDVAESERSGRAVWDVSTTVDTPKTLPAERPARAFQWTTERWVTDRRTNRRCTAARRRRTSRARPT